MQEQDYSFKDCLLLNPLTSLPLPGTVSTASVAFMCCSVTLFMFLASWWQGRWRVGLGSLCDLPAMCRDTLLILRPRLFYIAHEAHQPCFSTSLQVPVKDSLGCFHPTRCACSSMHLGVLVPWPTTWAKIPGHVASTW